MARYQSRRRRSALMSEMNVVPYIDVMLVLLVIFMITAPLLTTGVEVDLPNSDAKAVDPQKQSDPLVLSINDIGLWFLNVGESPDTAIDKESAFRLAAEVLSVDPNRGVMVAADENINYGLVMEAMVTLQGAGADKVQLMSDPAR